MEGFTRPGSLGGEAHDDDSVEGHIMSDERIQDLDDTEGKELPAEILRPMGPGFLGRAWTEGEIAVEVLGGLQPDVVGQCILGQHSRRGGLRKCQRTECKHGNGKASSHGSNPG
jgi:hypothetical protein